MNLARMHEPFDAKDAAMVAGYIAEQLARDETMPGAASLGAALLCFAEIVLAGVSDPEQVRSARSWAAKEIGASIPEVKARLRLTRS
jgi:hypothetical protein